MNTRVALFDLDGTVLDTLDDLWHATNHALSLHGMPAHTRDEIRTFVGNGIAKLIERAVPPDTAPARREAVLQDFKVYYKLHCADSTHPYPGILEMLRALRRAGVRTALVSNKADFAVQKLAAHYFPELFDAVLGERAEIRRKPAPDMVFSVLKSLGESPESAVFIGDSDTDVQTARNAGVSGLFVTWGFRDAHCLRQAGATQLADTPEQLLQAILDT